MKKKYLIGMALLAFSAVSVMFSSCSKDEEVAVAAPAITFSPASDSYIIDITSSTLDDKLVDISVSAEGEIQTLKQTKKVGSTSSSTSITSFDSPTAHVIHLNYKVADQKADLATGTVVFTFDVTDKKGTNVTKTLTFTKKAGVTYNTLKSWTATMGAQSNTTLGSSFASSNGTVYLLADAKTNSSLIDFVYYYGATNNASISAPGTASVAAVFGTTGSAPATWATKNATGFVDLSANVNATMFASLTNDSLIVALSSSVTFSNSEQTKLADGNVLGFKTAAGKIGLILVSSAGTSATGAANIAVKVQP